jgi:hypothetical protein
LPAEKTWAQFKTYVNNAHREHRLVSQTSLRSGYHAVNMVVQAPMGQLPRSSDIDDFYHRATMANE